ncbi:hypothetical protein CVT25_005927 [Psilocybe cyanescens]|uniref:Uncharacterized protein n=1 Tax=Psilocybe cyanescens TaxID=93625 RepID=A0A409XA26_PSICY|nr:hypothetical protein CVT25_005927 [Psilocybe cyanescens]
MTDDLVEDEVDESEEDEDGWTKRRAAEVAESSAETAIMTDDLVEDEVDESEEDEDGWTKRRAAEVAESSAETGKAVAGEIEPGDEDEEDGGEDDSETTARGEVAEMLEVAEIEAEARPQGSSQNRKKRGPAKSKGKGKRKSKSVQAEKAKEEKQGGYLDRGNGYVPTGIHKEFLNFGILATKRGFR